MSKHAKQPLCLPSVSSALRWSLITAGLTSLIRSTDDKSRSLFHAAHHTPQSVLVFASAREKDAEVQPPPPPPILSNGGADGTDITSGTLGRQQRRSPSRFSPRDGGLDTTGFRDVRTYTPRARWLDDW